MDFISLQHIRVRTRIGVPDNERREAQEVLISLEILHPLSKTAQDDALTNGIDYAAVTETVVRLASTERKTIERFAEDIAAAVLEQWKPAGGVKVTVTKKPELPLESASVTIVRP